MMGSDDSPDGTTDATPANPRICYRVTQKAANQNAILKISADWQKNRRVKKGRYPGRITSHCLPTYSRPSARTDERRLQRRVSTLTQRFGGITTEK